MIDAEVFFKLCLIGNSWEYGHLGLVEGFAHHGLIGGAIWVDSIIVIEVRATDDSTLSDDHFHFVDPEASLYQGQYLYFHHGVVSGSNKFKGVRIVSVIYLVVSVIEKDVRLDLSQCFKYFNTYSAGIHSILLEYRSGLGPLVYLIHVPLEV